MSPGVNKIIQEVELLDQAERDELRRALESLKSEIHQPRKSQEPVESMTFPPKPTPDEVARFNAWKPIELPGGPLSDDIIRDRR